MAKVATLDVDVVANTAGFNKRMEKASRKVNEFRSATKGGATGALALAGRIGFLGGALAGLTGSLLAATKALVAADIATTEADVDAETFGKSIGMATEEVDRYRNALEAAGGSQQQFDRGMRNMVMRTATGAQGYDALNQALREYGVDLDDVNEQQLNATEQLQLFETMLRQISDQRGQGEALAVAARLFGERSGQQMLAAMQEGDFVEARADVAAQSEASKQAIRENAKRGRKLRRERAREDREWGEMNRTAGSPATAFATWRAARSADFAAAAARSNLRDREMLEEAEVVAPLDPLPARERGPAPITFQLGTASTEPSASMRARQLELRAQMEEFKQRDL